MTTTPDYLTLEEHRDDSHPVERAARWTVIGLLAAIGVAALLNVFGERPTTTKATGTAAEARQQQIATLDDVAWGVLEGNGKLSFITKS